MFFFLKKKYPHVKSFIKVFFRNKKISAKKSEKSSCDHFDLENAGSMLLTLSCATPWPRPDMIDSGKSDKTTGCVKDYFKKVR